MPTGIFFLHIFTIYSLWHPLPDSAEVPSRSHNGSYKQTKWWIIEFIGYTMLTALMLLRNVYDHDIFVEQNCIHFRFLIFPLAPYLASFISPHAPSRDLRSSITHRFSLFPNTVYK
jgi:hypothetical protein